ncbi:MAG: TetR family transcriptional regulator [Alphaproteobacteria bacterium]|nr:TetR family transcriptional regulator [Alphaproteobacteria bacterium]
MGRTSDTREKLIETAIELMWRDSYNSVSVDDICKKADVKKGSFYHYFPSKISLANAAMQFCTRDMKSHYDNMFSPTRHPLDRLDLMVEYVIENQKEIKARYGHVCGCPFITIGSELAAQDDAMAQTISGILDLKTAYYKSVLKDLVDLKLIPADTNIDEKAQDIFSFIVGQLTTARIRNDIGYLENHMKQSLRNLLGVA